MATCGSCGANAPASARFCGSCGGALGELTCGSCGSANPPANRFCGQCGSLVAGGAAGGAAPIATAPPVVEERKLATVLFADVVGFTSLAETMDHETLARTVDAAFRRLGDVVVEHDGTIDKYMGDSLMAVFGVPSAHDDDAERAVASALAMRQLGGDLAFSIGVNTGEVMATSVGGDAVTVIGDAVNVAARLEKVAGAGEVLIGPLTAQLTQGRVRLRARRPVVVKGRRQPVDVAEAVGLLDAPDHGTQAGPPLVGRASELAFLRAQWDRVVAEGRAGVVLVIGEAGIGTTRLVEELCAGLADGATTVHASYPGYGAMGGPQVAAEVARQLGPTGDDEIDMRLRSAAGEAVPALRRLDAGALRAEQGWAMRRLLEEKAAERPLLVVLDDFHRAGDKTIELAASLVSRVAAPVLTVLVGRPEPTRWLQAFPGATSLRLSPLGGEDAQCLAEALAGARLHPAASEFFVGRARGNPLYLRELVAVARDSGQLVADGDALAVSSVARIPPSLRALLAARLDALGTGEKAALQHVAVLGGDATADEVDGLGKWSSAPALQRLVTAGLLRRQGSEERYEVSDPLLGEVAYETLPRHVRAERHQRGAEVAEEPEERARHLAAAATYRPEDADLRRQAAHASAAAALDVLDAARPFDAIRLLRQAIELGDDRASTALELAAALVDVDLREEAVEVVRSVPAETGDELTDLRRLHIHAATQMFTRPSEAVGALEEAAGRYAALGMPEREAWARANRGVALFNLSRMNEANVELQAAVDLFRATGDDAGRASVYGFLSLVRPEDPDVPSWLHEALQHAEEVGDRSRRLTALLSLAWHLLFVHRLGGPGEVAEAVETARALQQAALDNANPELGWHGPVLATHLLRLAGSLDEAAAALEASPALASVVDARPLGRAVRFGLDLARNGLDAPVPELPVESPDPTDNAALAVVVEALALAGRSEEAVPLTSLRSIERAGPLAGLFGGVTRGLALVLAGETERARTELEAAAASATRLGSPPGIAAAQALLAEVHLAAGDPDRAATLMSELDGRADVGGVAGAVVLRVRALLGDEAAATALAGVAERLVTPGLLVGVPVPVGNAPGG